MQRFLGRNGAAKFNPLQVYNWFEFSFPFSWRVAISKLKEVLVTIIVVRSGTQLIRVQFLNEAAYISHSANKKVKLATIVEGDPRVPFQ